MISRLGNHWFMSSVRAGCIAAAACPNNHRLASNIANTGAHACPTPNTLMATSAPSSTILPLYLDSTILNGSAKMRFPNSADDPNNPCMVGESPRSLEMEGSMTPNERTNKTTVPLASPRCVKTTHRNPIFSSVSTPSVCESTVITRFLSPLPQQDVCLIVIPASEPESIPRGGEFRSP